MKRIINCLFIFLIFTAVQAAERAEVIRKGQVTNSAEFATRAEAQAWFEKEAVNGSFGKPAHQKCEGAKDEQVCVDVPSEFEPLFVPIDSEIAAREAKKQAKIDAKKKLKEIDWSKVTTIAHLKEIVKNLVSEIEE